MFFTLFCAKAVVLRAIDTIVASNKCFIRNKFKKSGLVQRYKKVFIVTQFLVFFCTFARKYSESDMYNIDKVREDFPILGREVYKKPLVYLDNAATTQKPLCVLDAMRDEYLNVNANVHRGVHYLSQQATDLHEAAREKVREFINASKTEEIVFTRGTTEAINLVAQSFCESQMQAGDEVIVTEMEHHSNIVSWQLQAMKRGIVVKYIPITDDGQLDLSVLSALFSDRTKLLSVAHVSNVLGTVNPVEQIIKIAHAHNIPVLVDGAQSAPHFKVDVQAMDCDFFAFSGHKMYGPTGIGVLYGKEEWLEKLPPYQGGGEMIDKVTWERTTFERLPFKFEAGTPDYIATHGLATAIDYISSLGFDAIQQHEQELTRYCMEQLQTIEGMKIYGPTFNVQCSMFNVQRMLLFPLTLAISITSIWERCSIVWASPYALAITVHSR